MEGDSLKFNFEIALEKIDILSKHNQALLDRVQYLEHELSQTKTEINVESSSQKSRFDDVSAEAEAAMKRYKRYLKKEFKNAKSKQSKRQPVWKRDS